MDNLENSYRVLDVPFLSKSVVCSCNAIYFVTLTMQEPFSL